MQMLCQAQAPQKKPIDSAGLRFMTPAKAMQSVAPTPQTFREVLSLAVGRRVQGMYFLHTPQEQAAACYSVKSTIGTPACLLMRFARRRASFRLS